MANSTIGGTLLEARFVERLICLFCASLLFLTAIPSTSHAQVQQQVKPKGAEPIPEPAVAAILAAFEKYEVVGMPEAHGMKDVDDFILSLIRTPAFSEKVNDIAVECGNSLYQPVLDRYIAGEDVAFSEVRKVWRNTTQSMCGTSGFFEQFFPLVRAINRKLPAGKRLRVLAGDPPVDWDQVKPLQEKSVFAGRDESIASVMEKEVLSKHHKAFMLFGTFHLMHGQVTQGRETAVSLYEKNYPNVIFVITDLAMFDPGLPKNSKDPFQTWPIPSVARANGTWLGALDLGHFIPAGIMIDENCNVQTGFPPNLQGPIEGLVDAFLYLGPQDWGLWEQMLADVALDVDYRMELQRREALSGFPGGQTLREANQDIVKGAEYPVISRPEPPDPKPMVQGCLERKKQSGTPR